MKRLNNKGLTLVELVVVVAIMAVLLAVIGLSINTIFSNKSKAAAKDIYNTIGLAQTVGRSKGQTYLGLSTNSDGNVVVSVIYAGKKEDSTNFNVVEEKVLGSKVPVCLHASVLGASNVPINIDASHQYMIAIDRVTGAFGGAYAYKGDITTPVMSNVSMIEITEDYKIALSPVTGKYYYTK